MNENAKSAPAPAPWISDSKIDAYLFDGKAVASSPLFDLLPQIDAMVKRLTEANALLEAENKKLQITRDKLIAEIERGIQAHERIDAETRLAADVPDWWYEWTRAVSSARVTVAIHSPKRPKD